MENIKKPEDDQHPKNQGEGDKESAQKYNRKATKHAQEADVEKLAREAAEAEDSTKASPNP